MIQTTTYNPASGSTGVTRYVYNDGVCIQEIREDGFVAVSRVVSDGAVFAINITGTNYFTHGGVTEPTTFKYPILKGDYIRMRDVEMDDDISLSSVRRSGGDSNGYIFDGWWTFQSRFKYPNLKGDYIRMRDVEMDDDISLPVSRVVGTTITSGNGSIVERWDVDQDGRPVFLSATGTPNADNASSLGPIKWISPEALWIPEIRLISTPAGLYSPDLGYNPSSGHICGSVKHF